MERVRLVAGLDIGWHVEPGCNLLSRGCRELCQYIEIIIGQETIGILDLGGV